MVLKLVALLVRAASVVAEETISVQSRELVLVLVTLIPATWNRAQMPQQQRSRCEVSEALVALVAVADYCPVELQGLDAPCRPSAPDTIADGFTVGIPLEECCRLSAHL
jgi:hypothetical protein